MAREFFKPYNSANTSCFIEITDWLDEDDQPLIDNNILLNRWDPKISLTFNRIFKIDLKKFLEQTHLEKDDIIRFSNKYYSSGTNLRVSETNDQNKNILLNDIKNNIEIKTSLNVDGYNVSDNLILFSEIVLVKKINKKKECANVTGSILWQDSSDIILEGKNPLFPIEELDFAQSYHNANWFLEISSDLSATITSGIKLYINSLKNDFFQELLIDNKVQSLVSYEIVKQILIHCFNDDDFISINDINAQNYKDNTIGTVAIDLIRRIDNSTPESLYNLYISTPLKFDRLLQHHFSK